MSDKEMTKEDAVKKSIEEDSRYIGQTVWATMWNHERFQEGVLESVRDLCVPYGVRIKETGRLGYFVRCYLEPPESRVES